jgi:hypothetical protein
MQLLLADDESLVLFELLGSGKLDGIVDAAEGHVLDVMLAALERNLAVPLAQNYALHLEAARSSVVARHGGLSSDDGQSPTSGPG